MSFPNRPEEKLFWQNIFVWSGSVTPRIVFEVVISVIYAAIIEACFTPHPSLDLGPFEVSGAVLGVLLVIRTNAGYDRWWEGRKLWGGMVNQCRNLTISSLQYGPKDNQWRKKLVSWVAAFGHVAKRSLRDERDLPELNGLLSESEILKIKTSVHMPGCVLQEIARLLRSQELDGFSFLQMDRERALLLDHIGGCERILKTPLPWVLGIEIRQFIFIFIVLVPFVLIAKVGVLTPPVMAVIVYPLFALDLIGFELQNPFQSSRLSHLPLEDIANTIQENVFGYLKETMDQEQLDSAPTS